MISSFTDRFQRGYTIIDSEVDTFQGSYHITERGTYDATIYYPLQDSTRSFPVIIFAHGYLACAEWHTWIGTYLASKGYVTLLFTVPNRTSLDVYQWVDGISYGIQYMDQLNNESNQFRGMVDMNRVGVMGHSMGAMAAIIAASTNLRIKAVVALAAPYMQDEHFNDQSMEAMKNIINWTSTLKAAQNMTTPIQFQVGTRDAFTTGNDRIYFEATQASVKEILTIEGGNHVQFIDNNRIFSRASLEGFISLLLSLDPKTQAALLQNALSTFSKIIDVTIDHGLNIKFTLSKNLIIFLLSQYTLSNVAVMLKIDQPALITAKQQHDLSSQNFVTFFNLLLQ